MQDRPAPRKTRKSVNLSIDAELVAEAKAAGTNLSDVFEKALRKSLGRVGKLSEEDRAAIEAHNRHVAEHGLLSDLWRKF